MPNANWFYVHLNKFNAEGTQKIFFKVNFTYFYTIRIKNKNDKNAVANNLCQTQNEIK